MAATGSHSMVSVIAATLLTAVKGFGQSFIGLSTTWDGSTLYFSTALRQAGSGQPFWGKRLPTILPVRLPAAARRSCQSGYRWRAESSAPSRLVEGAPSRPCSPCRLASPLPPSCIRQATKGDGLSHIAGQSSGGKPPEKTAAALLCHQPEADYVVCGGQARNRAVSGAEKVGPRKCRTLFGRDRNAIG